jgi:hypothetical protein
MNFAALADPSKLRLTYLTLTRILGLASLRSLIPQSSALKIKIPLLQIQASLD